MNDSPSHRVKQKIERSGNAEIESRDISDLDSELNDLLSRIAAKQSYSDATMEMNDLCTLQELMALLCFKYDVELSEQQRTVVREFDRCDDEEN